MKSEIYSAYIAGLSPLSLLIKHRPDSDPKRLPDTVLEQAPVDLPRTSSRRRRALLLVLSLGLAIGAWQFLVRADENLAAGASGRLAAPQISAARA
jgi:hypothetical protein